MTAHRSHTPPELAVVLALRPEGQNSVGVACRPYSPSDTPQRGEHGATLTLSHCNLRGILSEELRDQLDGDAAMASVAPENSRLRLLERLREAGFVRVVSEAKGRRTYGWSSEAHSQRRSHSPEPDCRS